MKQKTAMMEAFDHLKLWIDSGLSPDNWFKNYEAIHLEKEKEQIMEAYDASQMEEWTDKDGLTWLSFYANANHYYNWKYKGQIISDEK